MFRKIHRRLVFQLHVAVLTESLALFGLMFVLRLEGSYLFCYYILLSMC